MNRALRLGCSALFVGYFFLPPGAGPFTGVGFDFEPPPGLLVVPVCFGSGPLGVFAIVALSSV